MHNFNEQESLRDMEIEIVDLDVLDSGFRLFFFSFLKALYLNRYNRYSRAMHSFPLILVALLFVVLLSGSSLMNSQVVHAHRPLPAHSSSLQFGACDVSINTKLVNGQTTTLPPVSSTSGESFVCSGQIQITVLPMPQSNRNHDP